jgi:hypothetical protein
MARLTAKAHVTKVVHERVLGRKCPGQGGHGMPERQQSIGAREPTAADPEGFEVLGHEMQSAAGVVDGRLSW